MAGELSIGQVAERSGISVSALHYYEREGLISAQRSRGNQRRYGRDVLRRLAIIRMAQELGLPLAAARDALAVIPPGQIPGAEDWRALSAQWRDTLDRRIVLLTRLRDELNGCIGCGCLSTTNCPIINPGDRLAGEGTGPRRLLRAGRDTYQS